eukprot:TRINITY_DN2142_c0_g2_i1.p1 TRINITY_DN2142_c0_g2~~TRINITY_DN2142_c0_g2_i1.p1  ORF type:complete len:323 (+),score=78.87 TRINITY_DN2142_c0_g2_i1:46-969(+)
MTPRVSVLGLGKMGGSMALRLVESAQDVVGWNRSYGKVEDFLKQSKEMPGKAEGMQDVMEAVRATDTIVMVLGTMKDTKDLLHKIGTEMKGKTVVNLCSGNPDEGREVQKITEQFNAGGYIDGAYSGPPAKARAGLGTLFLSCDNDETKKSHEDILSHLGENIWSGRVGASRALDYAVVDLALMNFMAYAATKSMMEAEGVDPEQFFACAGKRLGGVEGMLRLCHGRMSDRALEAYTASPIATLDTWSNFVGSRLPYMKAHNLPTTLPDATLEILSKASENGALGNADFTRLQEVLTYNTEAEESKK